MIQLTSLKITPPQGFHEMRVDKIDKPLAHFALSSKSPKNNEAINLSNSVRIFHWQTDRLITAAFGPLSTPF